MLRPSGLTCAYPGEPWPPAPRGAEVWSRCGPPLRRGTLHRCGSLETGGVSACIMASAYLTTIGERISPDE